ncbi:hypothetical protein FRC15_008612 [Serendipita sp. 397]|nr:hypothetical protein FRC15_008612 [Serendipita sp. 397]
MLRRHELALAFDESQKGRFKREYFSDYKIPTVPHVRWQHKPLPISPATRTEVSKMFLDKIKNGTYEPSQSLYSSRWFVVFKKNGKFRIVHDLQPLNGVTIRDASVPPNIDEFVESFAGRACYSVLDVFSGYDQRTLHPDSRDLTSFMTPDRGAYRLTSLPQGFTNSVRVFQNDMTYTLGSMIPDKAGVFVDDCGLKGGKTRYELADGSYETMPGHPQVRRFIYEHLNDVDEVLTRIIYAGITVAAAKLQIAALEATIVGHRVSYEGRHPDDAKIQKVLDFPVPLDTTQLRGFLGLMEVVRIFIKGFAAVARPLTALLKKENEWEWNDRCQRAFEELKERAIKAPCLAPIDYTCGGEVILAVESSWIAVGFILMQKNSKGKRVPARYGAITFNDRESRYSQPKFELYGLFRALESFSHFLFGPSEFMVEVDAKYIKRMLNSPEAVPNTTTNRQIEGILRFPIKLRHIPAKDHSGPDALSRRRRVSEDGVDDDSDEEREREEERPRLADENYEEADDLYDVECIVLVESTSGSPVDR